MEHKSKHIIHRILIYVLIVFSLSNLWGSVLGLEINAFTRFIITAVMAVAVHFICSYPIYWIIGLVTGIIPMLIISKFNSELVYNSILKIQQLFQNVSNYFKGTEQIFNHNLTSFWVLITTILCFCTWIIIVKIKRVWLLLPIYISSFVYYWYIYVDAAYPTMIIFLVLYFVLLGGASYLRVEKKWVQQTIDYNSETYPQWIKTALVYGIIIVMLAGILPKGNNLVEWYWIEEQITKRFPTVIELRDDLVYSRSFGQALLFDFSETGFQTDSSVLGGPVRLNDEIVMEVKSPRPLYLRGNVKTIYESNRWERDTIPQYNYRSNQLLEKEVVRGDVIEVEITNINMASYTIFTPYQPVRVVTETPTKLIVDQDYQVLIQDGAYRNEKYTVQAIVPHIRNVSREVEENTNITLKRYLQLPEGLSPKITELAQEITQHKDSSYEKAEAIQNFLRKNYVYSLEPTKTPEGREFIEYFLFEEKEGYCTYFATAMAVMLRTQGIPTRYIEGYRTPESPEDEVYIVRQKNAHAWVEVYIESLGWIGFEPTPVYQPPTPVSNLPIENAGNTEEEFDEWEMLLRLEKEANIIDSSSGVEDSYVVGGGNTDHLQQKAPWDTNKIKNNLLKSIYILFVGLLLFRILYIRYRLEQYLKEIKDVRDSISIPSLYQNILDLLAELGHPMEIGETPYEYSRRIIPNVYDKEYNFKHLTEVFVRARYGGQQSAEGEVENLLNYVNIIDKKLRVHLGFWQYYYKKYIKGTLYRNYSI